MQNEKQIAYWNEIAGPKWVGLGEAMERRFGAINELVLEQLRPLPGETILDIGCGTGITTLPLAAAVGDAGLVVGVDVSRPMLAVAAQRCAGLSNVRFLQADAQNHDFGGAQYDALTSRFGVMFFASPLAAFRNLRAALREGGRLCFICWSPLADNPHWLVPYEQAVARLGEPEPKPPHAPGPLGLSDIAYLQGILEQAGFSEIVIGKTPVFILGESLEDEARIAGMVGPAGALLDEKQADAEMRGLLRREAAEALQQFATAQGLRLPATVHLVQARN